MDITKEEQAKITAALADQKMIEQLSSSGKAAKNKREELRKECERREAAAKTPEEGKRGAPSGDGTSSWGAILY